MLDCRQFVEHSITPQHRLLHSFRTEMGTVWKSDGSTYQGNKLLLGKISSQLGILYLVNVSPGS